jgi:hypothetical protein
MSNPAGTVRFKYDGPGELAVVGGMTGIVYRFTSGTSQPVDERDISNVERIPDLKKVE